MQKVTLPNGQIENFPDEATQEQITEALRGAYPQFFKEENQEEPTQSKRGFNLSENLGKIGQTVKNIPSAIKGFAQQLPGTYGDIPIGAIQGTINTPSNILNSVSRLSNIPFQSMYENITGENPIPKAPTLNIAPETAGAELGNVLSGFAGGGLGRLATKLTPDNILSRILKSPLSTNQLFRNLEASAGTNISLGNVIENPKLKRYYENDLIDIPGGGTENKMQETVNQLENKAKDIMDYLTFKEKPGKQINDYGERIKEELNNEYKKALEEKESKWNDFNLKSDEYGAVSDPINLQNSAQKVLADIDKSRLLKHKFPKNIRSEIEFYASPKKNKNISEDGGEAEGTIESKKTEENIPHEESVSSLNIFRRLMWDEANKQSNLNNKHLSGLFGDLANATTLDIEDSLENYPALNKQYNDTMKFHAQRMGPFENTSIRKFLKEEADPNLLLSHFIRINKRSDRSNLIKNLMDALPKKYHKMISSGYFNNALYKKGHIKAGEYDPQQIASLYNSLGENQKKEIIPNSYQRKKIEDFSRMVRNEKRSFDVMYNPKTGFSTKKAFPLAGMATLAGGGYALGGIPAALIMGAGIPLYGKIATNLLSSEPIREKVINSLIKKSLKKEKQAKNALNNNNTPSGWGI